MFTGVIDEEAEQTIKKLGGVLVDSVNECTHLITDKVRRTVKLLCCLSRGCNIVSTSWITKCKSMGHFISADNYTINDNTSEKQYKFSLTDSINKARISPLLKGWNIYLTDNIKPCPNDMKDIINSAGGVVS